MSGRGRVRGRRHNNQNNLTLASVARETATSLAADSPVLAQFKAAATKLTERQDRNERLVKLSRDITIESKRIIFLLHSAITKESSNPTIQEAEERIQKLIQGPIKSIGLELENSPAYLHNRAVTAGFQEFVEAWTFLTLMEKKEVITWKDVQSQLTYTVKVAKEDGDEERTVVTMLTPNDYMLGIADMTGELMRKAINSISSGDSEECQDACHVVRRLYIGYLGLCGFGRELARKAPTTRANVGKVSYI
ncbi:translin associated factor X isoform X2 [Choristoneura fumiferana]